MVVAPQKLEPSVPFQKTLARDVHIVMRPLVNDEIKQGCGNRPNRCIMDYVAVKKPDERQMTQQQRGQGVGLEQNVFRVFVFRDKITVVAAIQPVMHNRMASKRLFWFARMVHPMLVPEPFKKTAIRHAHERGNKLRQNRSKQAEIPLLRRMSVVSVSRELYPKKGGGVRVRPSLTN